VCICVLSGCQTAISPVQVTRFHTAAANADVARGSFAMSEPANTLDDATYYEAVTRELQRLGYADVRTNPAASSATAPASQFIVTVKSAREIAKAGGGRSPVSVGVGGSTGGYGSGVGIGIGINLSGKPKDEVITTLSVSIRSSAGNRPVWEGRAESRAKDGTPGAQPGLAAAKLAAALFANYPGESGKTVLVP
jgi:hypothetical protein